MKPWKYRGYRCRFGSAMTVPGMKFRAMFFAHGKRGEEVAKAHFKCDLHHKIDLICDGLLVGTESATTATETAPGPSASTA